MERYKRNLSIDGFGLEGQEKLRNAKVLVVGAGGLGSPVLLYLAAAGVGTLGVADDDRVEVSNLQRQILYRTDETGKPKAKMAAERLSALNPETNVVVYSERFDRNNAAGIVREYDFVIDCCDNYATKYLINDICVQEGIAYSHGAVFALRGEAMTFVPGCPDYRMVFDSPPDEASAQASDAPGILGAIAGVIGSIQATEAIKYLTGIGTLITGRILIFDGEKMTFHSLKI